MEFAVPLKKIAQIFPDNHHYFLQFVRRKSVIIRQAYGLEPNFCFMVSLLYMNVRRFMGFVRVKMKAIAILSQDGWHGGPISGYGVADYKILHCREIPVRIILA